MAGIVPGVPGPVPVGVACVSLAGVAGASCPRTCGCLIPNNRNLEAADGLSLSLGGTTPVRDMVPDGRHVLLGSHGVPVGTFGGMVGSCPLDPGSSGSGSGTVGG